jgi:Flp pilus assembly protein TadG
MTALGSRRHRSRGQALVEFAIVLPIITLVVLGLFDLGRAVFSYNTLAQAARQANRTAIVDQDSDRVTAVAIDAAPTIGLSASNVTVCFKTADTSQKDCSSPSTDNCPSSDRVIGCLAIVTASLSYVPMTPVISTFWSTISLTSTSIEPIEYVCPDGTKVTCP